MKQLNKCKIHTLIEYQYNPTTKTFDETLDESYLYDGPIALAGGSPVRETGSWGFYDDGTEAASTLIGSVNLDPTLNVDTPYQWRLVVEETAGNKWNNPSLQLEYSHNGGAWTIVDNASSVIQSADPSGNLTEGADTTDRIAGTGAFIAFAGVDDTDGLVVDSVDPKSQYFNVLFGFTMIAADVADADTIELRIWDTLLGDTLNINQQFAPVIDVNKTSGTNYTQPVAGSLTGTGAPAKNILRDVLGSIIGTGQLSTAISFLRTVAGSLTASSTLNKKTLRDLLGSITGSGALGTIKKFTKLLVGSITASSIITKKTLLQILATITSSGSLNKATSRLLESSITMTGLAYKKMSLLLTSVITAEGAVAAKIVFTRIITGSITITSTITKKISRRLEASISIAGLILKRIPKLLSGSITLTNTLVKKTTRLLTSTLTTAGNLIPSFKSFKVIAGSIIMSGAVSGIIVIITAIVYHTKRLYYRMLGRR